MRKCHILFLVLFLSSATYANPTISAIYYRAETHASSNLYGDATDLLEGLAPVTAYSEVVGDLAIVQAWANADTFGIHCLSNVTINNTSTAYISGLAASSALEIVFELNSDTNWTLNIFGDSSVDYSSGGEGEAVVLLTVKDMFDTPIYSYDQSIDGSLASQNFQPGIYNLEATVISWAAASSNLQADLVQYSTAAAGVNFEIKPIPAPSALFLSGLGLTCVTYLRRRISLM